jgi:hypothetical protein
MGIREGLYEGSSFSNLSYAFLRENVFLGMRATFAFG